MDIENRSLESDMKADQMVIDCCRDLSVAIDFYRALCNTRWVRIRTVADDERIIEKLKGTEPYEWSCSWRYAGGIIADIRTQHHNVNDDYIDFYCSGNEGYISALVKDIFERMGWKPLLRNEDSV